MCVTSGWRAPLRASTGNCGVTRGGDHSVHKHSSVHKLKWSADRMAIYTKDYMNVIGVHYQVGYTISCSGAIEVLRSVKYYYYILPSVKVDRAYRCCTNIVVNKLWYWRRTNLCYTSKFDRYFGR